MRFEQPPVPKQETLCKVCGGTHKTGICTEQASSPSTGQQIEDVFKNIAGGIKENALAKVSEYDQRLRAAQEGQPLKTGDTVENLLPDFKRMTKQEWTENFDMDQYRAEQMGAAAESNVGAVERIDPVDAERVNNFILKLAEGSNVSDQDAIDAIVKQIKLLETDQNFPEILAALDPESYHPQVKRLDDNAKHRLNAAFEKYTQEKNKK